MVVDLMLGALFSLLEGIVGLFPTDSIDWPAGDAIAGTVGKYLGPLDPILPLSEIAATLPPLLTIVIPTIITARVTLWLYFMTPAIGGSGGD